MRKNPLVFAVLLVGLAVAVWYIARPKSAPAPATTAPNASTQPSAAMKAATASLPPDSIPQVAPVSAAAEDPTFEGIENLNAPTKTINDDLTLLNDLFFSWQATFARVGNPVGSNAEITAAFTGANKFGLAIVPKRHPAINADGELTDRWGTPFFFHQLSASRMEIRSAGPDRKLYTPDDAVRTPQ